MTVVPTTPDDLVRLRQEQQISQSRLAREVLNVHPSRVSRVEAGELGDRLPDEWIERLEAWLGAGTPLAATRRVHVPTHGHALIGWRNARARMSQAALGRIMGLSRQAVSRLERTDAQIPVRAREALRAWETAKDDQALPWTVPRTGAELKSFVALYREGGATMRDLADGIGVTIPELNRFMGMAQLPESFRNMVRETLGSLVSIPRTGSGLRRMICDLEADGVIDVEAKLAKIAGVKESTLKQYTHLAKLPLKFQKKLREHYRSDQH